MEVVFLQFPDGLLTPNILFRESVENGRLKNTFFLQFVNFYCFVK